MRIGTTAEEELKDLNKSPAAGGGDGDYKPGEHVDLKHDGQPNKRTSSEHVFGRGVSCAGYVKFVRTDGSDE